MTIVITTTIIMIIVITIDHHDLHHQQEQRTHFFISITINCTSATQTIPTIMIIDSEVKCFELWLSVASLPSEILDILLIVNCPKTCRCLGTLVLPSSNMSRSLRKLKALRALQIRSIPPISTLLYSSGNGKFELSNDVLDTTEGLDASWWISPMFLGTAESRFWSCSTGMWASQGIGMGPYPETGVMGSGYSTLEQSYVDLAIHLAWWRSNRSDFFSRRWIDSRKRCFFFPLLGKWTWINGLGNDTHWPVAALVAVSGHRFANDLAGQQTLVSRMGEHTGWAGLGLNIQSPGIRKVDLSLESPTVPKHMALNRSVSIRRWWETTSSYNFTIPYIHAYIYIYR